jgi:hypothetical protein
MQSSRNMSRNLPAPKSDHDWRRTSPIALALYALVKLRAGQCTSGPPIVGAAVTRKRRDRRTSERDSYVPHVRRDKVQRSESILSYSTSQGAICGRPMGC